MLEQQRISKLANQLNDIRLARILSILEPMQQHIFRLIPYLLHHNHSKLPGFVSQDTPQGIVDFSLDPETNDACEVFNFQAEIKHIAEPVFEGIYAMGSVASFGHSRHSDIDIWAVHRPDILTSDLELLRTKLDKLTQWFASYDLEVNFYLVHPQQFCREHKHSDQQQTLGREHSGSAQHWLLLEEFYRTQICLAGRAVAWWPHVKDLPELLHLGDVRNLDASEYFSASLWHLYKGIEKPHKALLKVLLLEAYASDYPNSTLLTDKIWQKILSDDFSLENDPYLVMYYYIEDYLLKLNDNRRLEVLRRCFYLKCGLKLTFEKHKDDWRAEKFKQLVAKWQWPNTLLQMLDQRENWHCGQIQQFNNQLHEILLSSYQTLLVFASKQGLSESLKMEELNILTRKLSTFFHKNDHQINQLRRISSSIIAEYELTVIQSNRDGHFYLYQGALNGADFIGESPIYKATALSGLLMWACFNQVAAQKTKWYIAHDTSKRCKKLENTSKRLLGLTKKLPTQNKVSKKDLYQPWYYRQLILLINLSADPTSEWQGQELMIDVLNANIFSLGRKKQNMLGSIDVLSVNSWGEWHYHSFKGKNAILDALTFMAPGLSRADELLPIEVLSCSVRLNQQLTQQIERLTRQILRLTHRATDACTLLQPIHIAEKRFGIFINRHNAFCQDLQEPKSFYQRISCDQLTELPRPEVCDDPHTCAPPIILDYAAMDAIQYFLRQNGEDIEVFVMDEHNQIQHYVQRKQPIEQLVSTISRHFAFNEITENRGHFNLPQFFLLQRTEGKLEVVPFGMSAEEALSDF
ncbi:class I adenylate cyclase [Parashewanella curva]|uniref:Class I adenylate cyclase n=1 Tax=Parashewanella curva TaxID=2338552 RepID=A0A3L8Q0I2_9GAMM|nr:class I adenylate cyclase [Parashewanella curva]RLV60283.1 class I adenylate cyclase [Parashewanella curva]